MGFTLVELMIVVAIVAILAAIAHPAYQEQIRKSRRGDAKATLLKNAQFMETVYTENKTYQPGGANPTLQYLESPDEGTKAYDLSLIDASTTDTSFLLQAVPTGQQTGNRCGKLTLSNDGTKGVLDAATGTTAADCW
ncbi:MAG: prepilin-type N-terminal cleavage/methylation domain-containing protein [Gammaproteobacteria bacterium]|nr:prepilin-type N-terminal cleavage/methylation domain-containing protein [Gammaproteobacteria bacterium]MCP5424858.1 prepilin-type N-terminal cleavage/methylation domain-containing protein [Gammaproteobacteria bacterium]MCP5458165.1 prepilin-type N-terminal cleavage/methylation domain-containing protein [Gammaproteobacteria bacterium]